MTNVWKRSQPWLLNQLVIAEEVTPMLNPYLCSAKPL